MGLDYSKAFQHVNAELFRVFRLYQTKIGAARRVPEQILQGAAAEPERQSRRWLHGATGRQNADATALHDGDGSVRQRDSKGSDRRRYGSGRRRDCFGGAAAKTQQEIPDLAEQRMPEPEVDAAGGGGGGLGHPPEAEPAPVERRSPAEEEQVVQEILELLHGHRLLPVEVGDVHPRGILPEVAPPPRDHARPHGFRRRKPPDDLVKDPVRQVSNPIFAAAAAAPAPFPRGGQPASRSPRRAGNNQSARKGRRDSAERVRVRGRPRPRRLAADSLTRRPPPPPPPEP
uniref:Uncharacterized protein n=1 Tax=Leersia perrieri TaxID=77586 RepID=A0A0D9XQE0_9ORYZ